MTDRRALRDFEHSLPMALLRAREAIMASFRPLLADHDLTEQQWRVLRALDAEPEGLEIGELAERTFLLGPSLSRILGRLEARRMVRRASVLHDQRRARITITPIGAELVATVGPSSERIYAAIADHLGPQPLDTLYDLLARLADAPATPPRPEPEEGR
ncbi:MAG: homoprotocatechuate degradation operon regulator HpaR [Actinomycetota bacterium]|nr:homoprotocatechuate degradation operon regulator HpaR [Actinomycetota bacterium]